MYNLPLNFKTVIFNALSLKLCHFMSFVMNLKISDEKFPFSIHVENIIKFVRNSPSNIHKLYRNSELSTKGNHQFFQVYFSNSSRRMSDDCNFRFLKWITCS